MTLKFYKDGKFTDISTRGNPPVCFIGGAKKKLVKGVVFINGEKRILWDVSRRIKIDTFQMPYANSSPTSAGCLWVSNSKLWAIYTTGRYGLKSYNLAATATQQESYDFGSGVTTAPTEESANNAFYLTAYSGARQGNAYLFNAAIRRCLIDASGNVDVADSYVLYNVVAQRYPPFTVSVGAKIQSGWASIGGTNYITPVPEFRIDGDKKYTFGTSATIVNTLVKSGANTLIGRQSLSAFEASVSQFTETECDKLFDISSGSLNDVLYDTANGVYVLGSSSTNETVGCIEIRSATDYSLLHKIQSTQDNRRVYRIVGKIGDYYYVLNLPFDAGSDQQGYLEAYDINGDRYHQVVNLPEIPDVDNFYNTKWTTARMIPIVSRTEHLGFFVDKYFVRILGV